MFPLQHYDGGTHTSRQNHRDVCARREIIWRAVSILMALYKRHRKCSARRLRIFAALACAVIVTLAPAAEASAQAPLDRIEWFAESGESFLRLGNQSGTFEVPALYGSSSYQATLVSPASFSSASYPPVLMGLEYRLTSRGRIQISYSYSINSFEVEPVGGGTLLLSHFERTPALAINYARDFGSVWGWRPFAVGGAGVVWQSTAVTGMNKRLEPSLVFGFGVDHRITDRLAFRVEARDYVERLASPLHGYSNVLMPTAGLVISSRPLGGGPVGLSRVEVYLEGGGSLLTGASAPTLIAGSASGSPEKGVIQGLFSKTGRYATGVRVYLSRRNALQFEYSTGPNHSQALEFTTQSPQYSFPPAQYGYSVEDLTANYARYLWPSGRAQPFVEGGVGWVQFNDYYPPDVEELCWNFGGGVDIPLAKQLALRFEMRDFLSHQPFAPFQPLFGWTNNLAPMVGIALRFR